MSKLVITSHLTGVFTVFLHRVIYFWVCFLITESRTISYYKLDVEMLKNILLSNWQSDVQHW